MVIVAIFGAVSIVTASSIGREINHFGAAKEAERRASADVFALAIADYVRAGNTAETKRALDAMPGASRR